MWSQKTGNPVNNTVYLNIVNSLCSTQDRDQASTNGKCIGNRFANEISSLRKWVILVTIRNVILCRLIYMGTDKIETVKSIGVRAGGARGAAAPPKFGQLRFFGQKEKFWAKPVFIEVSMLFFSRRDRYFLF